MGYSAETTHFGIPLPTGSDLTTPMDYNESAQAIDTAVFESQSSSDTALQKAIAVEEGLTDTNTEVTSVKGRVTSLEQTSQTQGTAITNLGNKVDDVKADALDMICAVDEGTAQIATVPVSEGDYFRYNDVLYMADDDIAIGDTIVPNTNCHATNVATELQNAGGGGSAVDTVARTGVAEAKAGVTANANAIGTLSALDTTDKSSLVAAINEVLSQIGGGGMKVIKEGFLSTATAKHEKITYPSEYSTLKAEDTLIFTGSGGDSAGTSQAAGNLGIVSKSTGSCVLSVPTNGGGYYQIVSLKG